MPHPATTTTAYTTTTDSYTTTTTYTTTTDSYWALKSHHDFNTVFAQPGARVVLPVTFPVQRIQRLFCHVVVLHRESIVEEVLPVALSAVAVAQITPCRCRLQCTHHEERARVAVSP
jgi:hypothetical protein